MTVSERGRKLLVEFESFERRAYKDPVGLWTIGIGHLLTPTELRTGKVELQRGVFVPWRDVTFTDAQVWALFDRDARWVEKSIMDTIKVPLAQHQFDALFCFVFNIGEKNFEEECSIPGLVNAHRGDAVPGVLNRWTFSKGKKQPGLVRRRKAEGAMWVGTT